MSGTIEKIRASLSSDALTRFDNILSKYKMADNVDHKIVDFDDCDNFIVKSTFNTKPYNGFVFIRDGNIADSFCI